MFYNKGEILYVFFNSVPNVPDTNFIVAGYKELNEKACELLSAEDILGLIKYKDFMRPDEKHLDSKRYLESYPQNCIVQYLCDLQERILRV